MSEFKYSNIEKEIQTYGFDGVVKSHCRMCHGGCGVLVYTKNDKVAKIAGDPDCPINHGTLCSKGLASAQLVYHPDRLTYPVRRVGPRARAASVPGLSGSHTSARAAMRVNLGSTAISLAPLFRLTENGSPL